MSAHVENVVQLYGDLLFDLCESVLWSPEQAQNAFRSILKEVRTTPAQERFTHYERAWILHIAFEKLKRLSLHHGRKVTSAEQIQIDASPSVAARLKHFGTYFHRLATEEQIVLLLRDKYGLPFNEIASATGLPEGSLKGIRNQALKALESWLWPEESA
jgi:DNA-directed RNA polymerase specialized sigma24 family protein